MSKNCNGPESLRRKEDAEFESVLFHNGNKVANCLQKFLPALLAAAAYFSGRHIDNRLVGLPETCVIPVAQFQFRGFLNKLRPLGIELAGYIDSNVSGTENLNISLNFRFPDFQEGQETSFASLSGDLIGVLPVSSVATNGEKVAENRSDKTAAQERHQELQEVFRGGFVWHFVLAVLGGLTGYAAISTLREWRLRREARS